MNIMHAVILAVVEGISEFLPISSTGHMELAGNLLRVPQSDFVKSFEIIIQFGAILAVLLLYWKKLLMKKETFLRVAAAFVPTAVVGLVLYKFIKSILLGNPWIVVWSLGIGGVLLILLELFFKRRTQNIDRMESMSFFQAFCIGCAQSVSIVPGVSRAAATIVGGLLIGLTRQQAVEFSFLLAIPTMAAATGLDLVKSGHHFTGSQWELLGIGFAGAFVSALIVVRWFIGFVKKHTFIPFGIYRIILAVAYAVFVLR